VPSQVSLVNSNLNSGDAAVVSWTTTNSGTGPALGSWADAIYLSRDGVLDSSDVKLGSFAQVGPLAAGASYNRQQSVALPLGATGAYQLLVVSDDSKTVAELGLAEENNVAGTNLQVLLSPYADLATTAVTAPQLVADSPAAITVGWTVTNNGTGAGRTSSWTDAVIASTDAILGNGDDIILGQFTHSGALQVGQSYTTQQRVFFPEGFSGRVNVFVVADYGNAVFENGNEADNTAQAGHTVDVMPVPYADLVVTSVVTDPTGESGQKLHVTWTVANQGIGITDTNVWGDSLTLLNADGSVARDANNNVLKVDVPVHFGVLAPGATYTASADFVLPNGISGPFRIGVKAADPFYQGGPFEFLYGNNNARASNLVDVTLAASPDLVVTSIVVPPTATESDYIDIAWTATNNGDATASGSWTDSVVLQPINRPQLSNLSVGTFTFEGSLDPGKSYIRTERFLLPTKTEGLYRASVVTNAGNSIYEFGAAALNNVTADSDTLAVQLKPRPDLQVVDAIVPDHAPAGGTASLRFTIVNQGTESTPSHWKDAVYLSTDSVISSDDVLLGTFDNGAALDPGEQYSTTTPAVGIPVRYRGRNDDYPVHRHQFRS
jgi:hypothetical protein